MCKRTDRVSGSRVKLHLWLKGKEQGSHLKMNSELLNRHPGLKKLGVAGWVKEEGANVAAGETLEKTSGLRASEGKKGKRHTGLRVPGDPGRVAGKIN